MTEAARQPQRHWTYYDLATGEISRTKSLPGEQAPPDPDTGEGRIETSYAGQAGVEYVDTAASPPALTTRPDNPATINGTTLVADGVAELQVANIPVGSRVYVMGPAGTLTEVNDGTLDITTDLPGAYTVTVRSWPQQVAVFYFSATRA